MAKKVLAICGSLRTGSYNKRLVLQACDILKEQGCEITYLDLRGLALPIYDGDLENESGMPAGATKLVNAIVATDAIVIGNPEYNSGITGALKNAIDWVSRAEKNPFPGKIVLLVGCSAGPYAAVRSHWQTRQILTHLGATVTPTVVTIPNNTTTIDEKTGLKDPKHVGFLTKACVELARFADALAPK